MVGRAGVATVSAGASGEHERRRQCSDKRNEGENASWENLFLFHRRYHF
jgi:hypothetical protein